MTRYLGLLLPVLLAGCGFQINPQTEAPWTNWVCDSQVKVYWRADAAIENGIEMRIGAGDMLHHLHPVPGGPGQVYSDSQVALRIQGEVGEVYWVTSNLTIGRNCKVPAE